ncbi:MAG TPA: TIGR02647 family protein [Pseudomonas sp.]|nr:TIGR02647 family protein [Pseudomonas sp.]
MTYTSERLAELDLLSRFNLANHQEGLKLHSDADPQLLAAAARLHAGGLLTQVDGGYLTGLGVDAAEHAQALLTLLAPSRD